MIVCGVVAVVCVMACHGLATRIHSCSSALRQVLVGVVVCHGLSWVGHPHPARCVADVVADVCHGLSWVGHPHPGLPISVARFSCQVCVALVCAMACHGLATRTRVSSRSSWSSSEAHPSELA